jgi:hypothetical protein
MIGWGGDPSTITRVLIVFPSQRAVPNVSFTVIGNPVGYNVPPPGIAFGNLKMTKKPDVPVNNSNSPTYDGGGIVQV